MVVFISHRWWRPDELQPDDAAHSKYGLLTRGLRQLVRRHKLEAACVVLWIDYVPS